MKRFLLFSILISLAFFVFSCGGSKSEENQQEVNKICNSNGDCERSFYCDREHGQPDTTLGTLVYYCKERTFCSTEADCPMNWKCLVSDHFCISKEEAQDNSLWCKSNDDCTDPLYPKCNLANGTCESSDGETPDNPDSGSDLPDPVNDNSDSGDDKDNNDNTDSDSDTETNDHDTTPAETPAGEIIITEDFEDGGTNWTIEPANSEVVCWEIGTPTSGPEKAHGGEKVAASILEGEYPSNCKDLLYYNTEITVPSTGVPTISFYAWVDIVGTGYSPLDYIEVLAKKSGDLWETTTGLYLSAETPSPLDALDNKRIKITKQLGTDYYRFSAKLSDFKNETVQIGFRFVSNESDESMGFYLDDVEVSY
ncbi:choice-of-anchor J domain-containing protein [bacterium]|nr:choice-of-anchor J domain-containing protein [bacterium]